MGVVVGGLRLLPFVVIGCVLVYRYNLELFGGVLHSDIWFGVAWGAFPALVGAYAQHWTLSLAAVRRRGGLLPFDGPAGAQHAGPDLRRRVSWVRPDHLLRRRSATRPRRAARPDRAGLRYFVWATGTLALALVLAR